MNSIKILITEKEKGCNKPITPNINGMIRCSFNNNDICGMYEDGILYLCDVCQARIETLKLCQEIQNAKVKELKNYSDWEEYENSAFKIKEVIDEIFGEETQAVKE
jgi:hypothetical protein